ncbi:MAG: S9 family peptidase [Bdellovibrionales bacterium]|nr:S9 family peptidase [Bdellovibrionales bacterium]
MNFSGFGRLAFGISFFSVGAFAAANIYETLEDNFQKSTQTWVQAQNQTSLAWFNAGPGKSLLEQEVSDSLRSGGTLAYSNIIQGKIYANFNRILKRIDADRFAAPEKDWEEFLNISALENLIGPGFKYRDRNCFLPDQVRCLISFSVSGSDKIVMREYDRTIQNFVSGGFELPLGKSTFAWFDADTILVGADLGASSVTTSGYARQVRLWKRSDPIANAPIVFEVPKNYVGLEFKPIVTSKVSTVLIRVFQTLWKTEIYGTVSDPQGFRTFPIAFPKSVLDFNAVGDTLIGYMTADESVGGTVLKTGSYVEIPLTEGSSPSLAYFLDPSLYPRYVLQAATQDRLWISFFDDVHGKLATLQKVSGSWQLNIINMPKFGVVGMKAGDAFGDQVMIRHSTILEADQYYRAEIKSGKPVLTLVAKDTPHADPSLMSVEQFKAKSKDGTWVPYFLIRRKADIGKAVPTVMYGYGGFGSVVHADTLNTWFPFYLKSFVSRGGAFVLAGIRGGGEYGEPWHQDGIRMKRWNNFDDFFAVAEDLIAKGATTSKQLGARGDSNGGILMGVSMTNRSDLFSAVVIKHGLFDMVRYTQMADAGPSWIAEFGDPADPKELAYIQSYSPYLNLVPGKTYPPVLMTTATNDDRVHPSHMRKAHAKLMELGSESIFYESAVGGHGRTDPGYRKLESAMELQFFMEKLGLAI